MKLFRVLKTSEQINKVIEVYFKIVYHLKLIRKYTKMRYRVKSNAKLCKNYLFTFTLLIIALIFTITLLVKSNTKKLRVYTRNETFLQLENILECEDQILKDKSIFFMDTTRMKHPKRSRELTLRQVCSIESAALTNPNTKIFVILVSTMDIETIPINQGIQTLIDYPNVYIKKLNLVQYSIDTPIESFIANGTLFKSIFVRSHTSDVLRLLFLWKYGGTYVDTDMIVLKDLNSIPPNFICKDYGFLNGAIINMNIKEGRKFAELFIKNMVENFSTKDWGQNGPLMLQRVLKDICKTDSFHDMHNCNGFNLMDPTLCYPIKGQTWEKLFDEKNGNKVAANTRGSIVVHFWNKLSHNEKLLCNSKSAYLRLAREYCPKSVKLCKGFF